MPLLIIDCLALCHRAKHAMENVNLTYEEERTNIIYSFFEQIIELATHFSSSRFCFAWDSHRSYRTDLYQEYKFKRQEDKTAEQKIRDNLAYRQFNRIRCKILPSLGFKNRFIQTGLEADDIIASLTQTEKGKLVIVSRDHDLFQLLSKNVIMYDFQYRKTIDAKSFEKEYNISYSKWGEVKAIAGCTTDNVKGIEGVGEKTAIKYINGELPEKYKAYKAIVSNQGKRITRRNRRLVCLPFKGTKKFVVVKDKLYSKDFYDTFEKLGFQSFISAKNFREWEKAFNLH